MDSGSHGMFRAVAGSCLGAHSPPRQACAMQQLRCQPAIHFREAQSETAKHPLPSLPRLGFAFEATNASNKLNMDSRPKRLGPQLLPNGTVDSPPRTWSCTGSFGCLGGPWQSRKGPHSFPEGQALEWEGSGSGSTGLGQTPAEFYCQTPFTK